MEAMVWWPETTVLLSPGIKPNPPASHHHTAEQRSQSYCPFRDLPGVGREWCRSRGGGKSTAHCQGRGGWSHDSEGHTDAHRPQHYLNNSPSDPDDFSTTYICQWSCTVYILPTTCSLHCTLKGLCELSTSRKNEGRWKQEGQSHCQVQPAWENV